MHARKSIVSLTFDDGREEQYNRFYPILAEHDLNATFYVITERIGWKGVMGWDELKTLYKDGNEIGSHTHTHSHLTTLSNDELDSEFKKSYDMLSSFNCSTLAYPYGESDERVAGHARKRFIAAVGYENPNTRSQNLRFNFDLNQERYKLKIFPLESRVSWKNFKILKESSLFGLPFSKFKLTIKELLEYNIERNGWIIFSIHGLYHGNNISWLYKKPKETMGYFVIRLTRRRSIKDFLRRSRDDRTLKFHWMCKYLTENDELEVLPVSQVIRKYLNGKKTSKNSE